MRPPPTSGFCSAPPSTPPPSPGRGFASSTEPDHEGIGVATNGFAIWQDLANGSAQSTGILEAGLEGRPMTGG